jgi:hypothetical protein
MKPKRVQLSRKKAWRMPPNTVNAARPGKWGNPFEIGGWFMVGDPQGRKDWMGMVWCRAASKEIADRTPGKFTLIESQAQAVEFFERLQALHPWNVSELKGKDLACWCKPGTPCHVDVLLKLANDGEGKKV